jgi:beta-phosphoglucomutase
MKVSRSFTILFLKEKTTIALGSASKTLDLFRKTGLLSYFDAVVDGNDVTKLDHEVFLMAAKLLIREPYKLFFEDSVAGVQAAILGI